MGYALAGDSAENDTAGQQPSPILWPLPAARPAAPPDTTTALELIATIAHELRGPLQAVALSLELLADVLADALHPSPADDQPPVRHDSEQQVVAMRRHTVWLQALLENLLYAVRFQDGPPPLMLQPVDLGALIEEVRGVVAPVLAEREQTLRVALAADLPLVRADGRRLGQVLTNLLLNASQYGPAATPIDLHVKIPSSAPAGRTWHAAHTDESGHTGRSRRSPAAAGPPRLVRVTVSDRGPGLAAPTRARLVATSGEGGFMSELPPMVLTSAAASGPATGARGLGLGLEIVQAIVRAHGGRVGAHQRTGGGAAVWFELPIREPAPAEPRGRHRPPRG